MTQINKVIWRNHLSEIVARTIDVQIDHEHRVYMRTYACLTIFQSEVSGPIPHTRINMRVGTMRVSHTRRLPTLMTPQTPRKNKMTDEDEP